MKRRIPLTIIFILGWLAIVPFFVPHRSVQGVNDFFLQRLLPVIGAFALILGLGSIINHHLQRVRRKKEYWPYSYVFFVSMIITAIIGLFGGMRGEGILSTNIGVFRFDVQIIFMHILVPLGGTMFALLAFFMTSAAYRAFRARNLEAALLLAAAFIVMLAVVPTAHYITPKLPAFAEWILTVPNTAAKRGILMGVGLGMIATSIKIILGIERGWLGGGG